MFNFANICIILFSAYVLFAAYNMSAVFVYRRNAFVKGSNHKEICQGKECGIDLWKKLKSDGW